MTQRIMGEESLQQQHADAQPSHLPYPHNHQTSYAPSHSYPALAHEHSHHPNGTAAINGDDEPYTIKCICDFQEDDGNTVLCEQCNTWQHIQCYYSPTLAVPDIHKCVDCWPRFINSAEATQRQQRLREPHGTSEDRRKRPAPRGTRRPKLKDLNQIATQTNGWPAPEGTTEGSPRDQPPPAKRPKTSHKSSNSVSANSHPRPTGNRNRSGSNIHAKSLPVRPPLSECPPDYFSPDFIQIHRTNTAFTESPANLHLNIGVSNLLSTWLDDTDAFAAATHGRTHEEVFKHFPQPIEELETPIKKNIYEDDTATFHGHHPIWPYLTVEKDLNEGDFVGELRGSIGHRDEYKADPSNRWDRLRHPDHFVFFHSYLPIYIDCRNEGSLLRYARRSCQPNLKLETIITGDREYRFVFTALTDLPNGTEITVPWDTQYDRQLQDCLSRGSNSTLMNESEKAYVQDWVQTILAHFGGCACVKKPLCLMAHFDHRLGDGNAELSAKVSKTSKRKRSAKRSPPNHSRTGNSRAGSEAVLGDQDADIDDDRSTSHSAPTVTSREGTPTSRHLHDGSNAKNSELSERDKRKLIQQERLFDKMENDQGSKKKKRHSGSNANTPGATGSKQGYRRTSTSIPNTPGPSGKPRMVDSGTYFNLGDQSPSDKSGQAHSPVYRAPSRPSAPRPLAARPEYADASTQTDPEEDTSEKTSPSPRRSYTSLSKRLLRRSRLSTVQNAADDATAKVENGQSSDMTAPPIPPEPEPEPQELPTLPSKQDESQDVEMEDPLAQPEPMRAPEPVAEDTAKPSPPAKANEEPSEEPVDQPQQARNNFRSTNLHVDLPPPPLPSSASLFSPLVSTPGSQGNSSLPLPAQITHSSSAPPTTDGLPLPGIARPSPVKKMSLSDYMNKRKTPASEKTQGQSMLNSGPASAPLTNPMKALVESEPTAKDSPTGSTTAADVKQEDTGEHRPS